MNSENIDVPEGASILEWKPFGNTTISAKSSLKVNAQPKLKIENDIKYLDFTGTQRMDFSQNIFSNNNILTIFIVAKSRGNGHILGIGTPSTPYLPYLKGVAFNDDKYLASARNNSIGSLIESDVGNLNLLKSVYFKFKNKETSVKVKDSLIKVDSINNLNYYNYTKASIGASDGLDRDSLVNPYNGMISEIIVYNGELSEEDINKVNDYLNLKYFTNKKYLVLHDSNYKYYNNITGSWSIINEPVTNLTFMNYGMKNISNLKLLEGNLDILLWIDNPINSNSVSHKLSVTPQPQEVIPKSDIDIIGVESIDNLNLLAQGNVRVGISFDSGLNYYSFNNGVWNIINEETSAMTVTNFNSLTSDNLQLLRNNSNFLRFKYYLLDDSSVVDRISMTVSMQGYEKIAETNDYTFSYDQITRKLVYNITKSGTYSVNYVDGSV